MFLLFSLNSTSATWPKKFDAPQVKYEETKLDSFYKYTTKSYTIFSNQRIREDSISKIANVAESVNGAIKLFPISLQKNMKNGRYIQD